MQKSLLNHFVRAIVGSLTAALILVLVCMALLRWLPPPTTAFMLQSQVKPVRYTWVPLARISQFAGLAVIASEDQKFRLHHGFDVEAMQKAYEQNQKNHHRKRGASTISQQTAKNLFLWPEGGYARKAVEAALTSLMELMWSKDRILEMYLNIAEFGPGIYGVEAASRAYFSKSAANLSPDEAARLAAVLPNPRQWNAKNPGPYVQRRANWVMGQMGYGSRSSPVEEPDMPTLPTLDVTPSPASASDIAPTVDQAPMAEPSASPPVTPDTPSAQN